MATEIRLPQFSMGMTEGTVAHWVKKVGETVNKDEPVVEIETSKVTTEVTSENSGVILKILVAEGETVPVRTVLCLVGSANELVADGVAAKSAAPPAGNNQAEMKEPSNPVSTSAPGSTQPEVAVQVTPVARRLAKDHGLDLGKIKGSGPSGRITEKDVEAAIAAATNSPDNRPAGTAQLIPLTGMRGTIAQRMHQSLQTTAQLTLITEADVTELKDLREKLNQEYDLTYTDLLLKAVARALPEHPRLNGWVLEGGLQVSPEINLGMAVALADGLIVPVVHNTEHKSLKEIAGETRQLAQKAREGKLQPGEVSGGTFTITNLGMYGIDAFTPIINLPEVAILGVGRMVEKPIRGSQGILWRQMLTLSLTFDHRAVDGAPAAAFLQAITRQLEAPAALAE
jgi:pyruvate dehydrogenase E2 component (dihydrolipoamide acetyltransferase)